MVTINLRELYPERIIKKDGKEVIIKNPDCLIEVQNDEINAFKESLTEEIADFYFAEQRAENAYQRQLYRYDAHYSLDCGDGIESDSIHFTVDPLFELLMNKMTKERLYAAIDNLREKQRERIYSHYFLDISKVDIAKSEDVDEKAIRVAIKRGIASLKKNLKNF